MLAATLGAPSRQIGAASAWVDRHCTTSNGALRVRPRGSYVSGYFGTLLADALVRARVRPELSLRWMQWYVAHAHGSGSGIDGVPDDVDVYGAREISRGRPDSTDAYGAVFMILANDAYGKGDPALRRFVLDHRADLIRIANSSIATLRENGLTWARPQHRVFYAIDNEQVYVGMKAAASLFLRAFHDLRHARRYARVSHTVGEALHERMWDPATQAFRPYLRARGTGDAANLSRRYPDALAQVLAVYYGVIPPKSAAAEALIARSAPALESPDADQEDRLALLATERRMGAAVGLPPFTPPLLCVDAAWYFFAATVESVPR